MSIRIMAKVWDESPSEGRALLVELALADFANDDGYCFPAVDTAARKARCSIRLVQDTVRNMEAAGRMKVEYGAGPSGTNIYRFLQGAEIAPPQPATGGGAVFNPEIAPDPSGTVKEPSPEIKKRSRAEIVADVVASLRQCRTDFERAFTGVDFDRELERFADYLISHNRTYSDYRAAFRNWLRRAQENARTTTPRNNAGRSSRPPAAAVTDGSAWERFASGQD